jgi:hypothetical protein
LPTNEGRALLFQGGFAGHGKWFRGSWVHPRFRKATWPRRIAIAAQILVRDRTLLVGICPDQARIDLHCFNSN